MTADFLAELPAPQRLALSYSPGRARPATLALLTLDARLAAILRGRREPLAAQLPEAALHHPSAPFRSDRDAIPDRSSVARPTTEIRSGLRGRVASFRVHFLS